MGGRQEQRWWQDEARPEASPFLKRRRRVWSNVGRFLIVVSAALNIVAVARGAARDATARDATACDATSFAPRDAKTKTKAKHGTRKRARVTRRRDDGRTGDARATDACR